MRRLLLLCCFSTGVFASECAKAQDSAAIASEEQAIRKTIVSYVEAYNRRDATAVAAHWATNAVLVDLESGEKIVGRNAIQEDFAKQFAAQPKSQLEVDVESIRLVAQNVAVEDGFARILDAGTLTRTSYTVVHVKQKDGWKIDSVRETVLPGQSGSQLSELDWMVGRWTDASEDATVESEVKWARNERFLTMNFRVSSQDAPPLEGTQIIGVDPATGKIRSWLFDSDGGVGRATWLPRGGKWISEMTMTLPGGESASAINEYTPVDANSYKWRSFGRRVAGQSLPEIEEVVVKRASE